MMNKSILITMVVILFFLGFFLVGYSLFSSVALLPKLSNSTSHINDYKQADSGVYFGRLYFYEPYIENSTGNLSGNGSTIDICQTLKKKEIIIAEVIYDPADVPDDCEILVDSIFQKTLHLQELLCVDNCTQEIKLSIDLKPQTLYDAHEVELCCDGLCNTKKLDALC